MYFSPSLLPDLPALLVIAEECHFGRAAERLNVSQPRVSQIVRRVEDIVGFAIFVRRPQVRLTQAGELLTNAARHVLGELDAAFSRAQDAAAGRGGTVRLGYAPVAMLTRLPGLLKSFRERHPLVTLHLHQAYSSTLWDGLESGAYDVIVSRETRVLSGVRNHLFLRDSLVVVLPEGDPEAGKTAVSVASLRNRAFVTIEEVVSPQWHQTVTSLCRSAGFEPRVAQRANDWAATLALVASGMGISIVSSTLAQLRFPGIAFVPVAETLDVGAFWIACREDPTDPAVNLLRSELIDEGA